MARTPLYAAPEFSDRILRVKVDTGATCPTWAVNQWDPNTFSGVVGGVADAGDLTLQITPEDTANPTPAPIVATLTTETLAQAAELIYTETLAAIAADVDETDVAVYLSGASYVAAGTEAAFLPRPYAPAFTVTLTGTVGTTTFTLSPDDVFPISAVTANLRGEDSRYRSQLAISFIPLANGVPIVNDNACVVDVTYVRVVERRTRTAELNEQDRPVGVTSSVTTLNHDINHEYRVDHDGGRFGIQLSALTDPPTGIDALEIRWRQVAG